MVLFSYINIVIFVEGSPLLVLFCCILYGIEIDSNIFLKA